MIVVFVYVLLNLAVMILSLSGFYSMRLFFAVGVMMIATPSLCWLSSILEYIMVLLEIVLTVPFST